MKLRFHPLFKIDVIEAEDWIEENSVRLANELITLVKKALLLVENNPRSYSPTEDGPLDLETREYYIKRFEYRVIYVVGESELVVLALVHARKRPGSWVKRLLDLRKDVP